MKEDYIFLSNGCANERYKSVGTLNSGWMVMYIASVKIPEREGSISSSSFYGQLPDYYSQAFSLIYPMDEFSWKEMRTWDQSKILSYCFCVWCESRELGSRGSSRLPCVTPVVEAFSDRVTFRNPSNMNNRAPLRKQPTGLTRWLFPEKKLHRRPPTRFQMWIQLEVLQIWGLGGLQVHGIGSGRLEETKLQEI